MSETRLREACRALDKTADVLGSDGVRADVQVDVRAWQAMRLALKETMPPMSGEDTREALVAKCQELTDRASDILNTTNDRYQTGRADGILLAVEAIERLDVASRLAALQEAIALRDGVIREHAEAASIFQPGGKRHEQARLRLGASTVVEGIKWLDTQLSEREAASRLAAQRPAAEPCKNCDSMARCTAHGWCWHYDRPLQPSPPADRLDELRREAKPSAEDVADMSAPPPPAEARERVIDDAEATGDPAKVALAGYVRLADADLQRRREALVKIRAHTSYLPGADRSLLVGLLQSIERITDAALAEAAPPRPT